METAVKPDEIAVRQAAGDSAAEVAVTSEDPVAQIFRALGIPDGDGVGDQFENLYGKLLAFAAPRIGQTLQSQFAPDDIVQSAIRTFLRYCDVLGPTLVEKYQSWPAAFACLKKITRRKISQKVRMLGLKPGHAHEVSVTQETGEKVFYDNLASEMTSDNSVIIKDIVNEMNMHLDDRDRRIFTMYLLGYDVHETAHQLGISPRTVQLRRKVVIHKLQTYSDSFIEK